MKSTYTISHGTGLPNQMGAILNHQALESVLSNPQQALANALAARNARPLIPEPRLSAKTARKLLWLTVRRFSKVRGR